KLGRLRPGLPAAAALTIRRRRCERRAVVTNALACAVPCVASSNVRHGATSVYRSIPRPWAPCVNRSTRHSCRSGTASAGAVRAEREVRRRAQEGEGPRLLQPDRARSVAGGALECSSRSQPSNDASESLAAVTGLWVWVALPPVRSSPGSPIRCRYPFSPIV